MKKVSIITILDNINCGTYLQAVALALSVHRCGAEAELINYKRECADWRRMLMGKKNPIKWIYNLLIELPAQYCLRKKNYKFVRNFVSITTLEYHNIGQLKRNIPVADIYMTGSDQVWNSFYNHGVDPSFYLDFVPHTKPRVAYAASIGMDEFPSEQINEITHLLKKYKQISVREQSAFKLLSSLGINNVEVVLDPTFLLDNVQWNKIAAEYEKIVIDEPYLLIYSVETVVEHELIEKYATEVALKNGWKIYEISTGNFVHRFKCAHRHFFRITPDIFLNLMLQAKFVIASSFHGTAFSVNFGKQFLTVSPGRFRSRVGSLLAALGLNDRIINNDRMDVDTLSDIDYKVINEKLAVMRNNSWKMLKQLLDN